VVNLPLSVNGRDFTASGPLGPRERPPAAGNAQHRSGRIEYHDPFSLNKHSIFPMVNRKKIDQEMRTTRT